MSLTIDLAATESYVRDRFESDAADLTMKVLHDDGIYRHLRFTGPNLDWFDLITWPGRLTVDGGHGTYTFSRQEDMLTFFRVHPGRGINPHYWSEKLIGPEPGREPAKAYSEAAYREHVKEALDDWLESYYENEAQATSLRAAVQEELLDPEHWDYPGNHHSSATERIAAFRHKMIAVDTKFDYFSHKVLDRGSPEQVFTFEDAWEWDLSGWDFHFLWCCWAIRYGVQQYDAHKAKEAETAVKA